MTPDELGTRGRAFYDYAMSKFVFDRAETELLTQACRMMDRADALRDDIATHGVMLTSTRGARLANPAIAAERQVSLALGRLLGQLEIPSEDAAGGGGLVSPTTARARHAAQARWHRHETQQAAQERQAREGASSW